MTDTLEGFFESMKGSVSHPVYGPIHALKSMPDGREGIVVPSSFGTARVIIGEANKDWYEDMW